MKILVCGSRDFDDISVIYDTLEGYYRLSKIFGLEIIHGACNTNLDIRQNKELGKGADAIAHAWCRTMAGIVQESPYPADWNQYGKRAGYVRNAQMLEEGKPDIVLGFMNEETPGTTMMLNLAKKAGVPTYRIQVW